MLPGNPEEVLAVNDTIWYVRYAEPISWEDQQKVCAFIMAQGFTGVVVDFDRIFTGATSARLNYNALALVDPPDVGWSLKPRCTVEYTTPSTWGVQQFSGEFQLIDGSVV